MSDGLGRGIKFGIGLMVAFFVVPLAMCGACVMCGGIGAHSALEDAKDDARKLHTPEWKEGSITPGHPLSEGTTAPSESKSSLPMTEAQMLGELKKRSKGGNLFRSGEIEFERFEDTSIEIQVLAQASNDECGG